MKLSEEQKNAFTKDEQTKKVMDYLNAENGYLEASLKHTEDLQEKLYEEMVASNRLWAGKLFNEMAMRT